MSKIKVSEHPRQFQLFYGESQRTQVTGKNYKLRSRTTTLTNAMAAAVRRLHRDHEINRVDIFDDASVVHMGFVRRATNGYQIELTSYGWKLYTQDRRINGTNLKY